MLSNSTCSVSSCERKRISRAVEWCNAHYGRVLRTGDPQSAIPIRAHTRHLPPEERFWLRVEKSEDCWLWTASTDVCGYGRFYVQPRYMQAHRYSYEIFSKNEIPPKLQVLHRCDNPPCVRPDHLFLGSNLDNIKDMEAKGRKRVRPPRGGLVYNAKLTWEDVLEIRRRHQGLPGEESIRATARKFGMAHGIISGIVRGKRWQYPPEEWSPPRLPKQGPSLITSKTTCPQSQQG